MIKNLLINFKKRIVLPVTAVVVAASSASAILPALSASALTGTNVVPVISLDGWDTTQTRTAGHQVITPDGLHVYTDNNTSQAKAAAYHTVDTASLSDYADFSLDWTGTTPAPGGQLVVDLNGNGTVDGTLVVESVYGGNEWLANINHTDLTDLDTVAPQVGGGGGQYNGTFAQWLAAYPNATVSQIGYSLGSGVQGDGVISSITAGDTTYQFGSNVTWNGLTFQPNRTTPSSVNATNDSLTVNIDQARTDVTVTGAPSSVSGYKFYGVEGLGAQLPARVNYISADLYVDPSWSTKPVSAGLWGTTTDSSSVTPVIEYASGAIAGGTGAFRVFDTMDNAGVSTSLWTNLDYAVTPGQTYNLGIKDLDGQYHYYINGTEVAVRDAVDTSVTPNVSYPGIDGVLLQSYNSHTGNTADNYSVKWSNLQAYDYITLPDGSSLNTGTPVDDGHGNLVTTLEDNVTTSGSNTTVTIPAGTTITASAGSNWDGVIAAPTAVTVTVPVPGYTTTVAAAVSIGDPTVSITFSQSVSVTLAGQAGKLAGYIDHSGVFHAITKVANEVAAEAAITTGATESAYDNGSDLVILTTHFTTFVAYSETANTTSSHPNTTASPSTATDDTSSDVATDDQTPTGAETTADAANTDNSDQSVKGATDKSAGFAWYWWVLIILALLGIGYGIYRSSAKEDK